MVDRESSVNLNPLRLELDVSGLLRGTDAKALSRTLLRHPCVLSCTISARIDRCSLLLDPQSDFAELLEFLPDVGKTFNLHIRTFPDQHLDRRQCFLADRATYEQLRPALLSDRQHVRVIEHHRPQRSSAVRSRSGEVEHQHDDCATLELYALSPAVTPSADPTCLYRHRHFRPTPTLPPPLHRSLGTQFDQPGSAVRKRALPLLFSFAPLFFLWLWCVIFPYSSAAFSSFARSATLFGVPGLLDLVLQSLCVLPLLLGLWWRSHFTWYQLPLSISWIALLFGFLLIFSDGVRSVAVAQPDDPSRLLLYQVIFAMYAWEVSRICFRYVDVVLARECPLSLSALNGVSSCTRLANHSEHHDGDREFLTDLEEQTSVLDIHIGDELKIYPDQTIPVDGVVTFGSSAVEEEIGVLSTAKATRRATKGPDSVLLQGSQNAWGTMKMTCTRAYKHSVVYSLLWAYHRALVHTLSSGNALLLGWSFALWELSYCAVIALLTGVSLLVLPVSGSCLLALALVLARPQAWLRSMRQTIDLALLGRCCREGIVFSSLPALERCTQVDQVLIPESMQYQVERLLELCAVRDDIPDRLCAESNSRIQLGNPDPEQHGRVAIYYLTMEALRQRNRPDVLQVVQQQADQDGLVIPAFAQQDTPLEVFIRHASDEERLTLMTQVDQQGATHECTWLVCVRAIDSVAQLPIGLLSVSLVPTETTNDWLLGNRQFNTVEYESFEQAESQLLSASSDRVAILLPPNLTQNTLQTALSVLPPSVLLVLDLSQQSQAGACAEFLQRSHPLSLILSGVPEDSAQFQFLCSMHRRRTWLRRLLVLFLFVVLGAYALWLVLGVTLTTSYDVWSVPVPWIVALVPSALHLILLLILSKAVPQS